MTHLVNALISAALLLFALGSGVLAAVVVEQVRMIVFG